MAKTNAKAVEALVGVDQSIALDRDPVSLKDGAYQQAKAGDRIRPECAPRPPPSN